MLCSIQLRDEDFLDVPMRWESLSLTPASKCGGINIAAQLRFEHAAKVSKRFVRLVDTVNNQGRTLF